ncbi:MULTISPECIES: ROK family glucokinase [Bacillaceae]|uniref:Glucokinase n=1 Tax=Evansella alkalicola TaxID=745819 RepID=A0ABS6K189_9BACI|nr:MULTISPECIES: ROK family glucokinase [Bacillaceae]MBU9724207.1 ROK family glucokinase [Bacillus alkalicola]
MTEKILVGIDIGGTTVKQAFIDMGGNIITKWEIPTDKSDSGKNIVPDIVKSVQEKLEESQIHKSSVLSIGVGAPGFIDVENGMIFEAVNLGWKNFGLKKQMEELMGVPTFVDNDANLASVGEMWKGAGNGATNLVCVTLGTGVGGGVIAGGEIIHGQNGMAGEIGHIASVVEGGAPCNCGKKGCLETVASATGIARLGLEAVTQSPEGLLKKKLDERESISARDVLDAAKAGDDIGISVVDTFAHHLGLALANLSNTLNPETIVIGGGVSKAGTFLVDKLEAEFKKYAIPKIAKETAIRIATLGNDAGVIGAAWLGKTSLKKMENEVQ